MVDLMLVLNVRLRNLFESNWICKIKWQRGCTWHFTWWRLYLSITLGTVEGAPDASFVGRPTSEAEIKGALEVTIELYLKIYMVVHLLV